MSESSWEASFTSLVSDDSRVFAATRPQIDKLFCGAYGCAYRVRRFRDVCEFTRFRPNLQNDSKLACQEWTKVERALGTPFIIKEFLPDTNKKDPNKDLAAESRRDELKVVNAMYMLLSKLTWTSKFGNDSIRLLMAFPEHVQTAFATWFNRYTSRRMNPYLVMPDGGDSLDSAAAMYVQSNSRVWRTMPLRFLYAAMEGLQFINNLNICHNDAKMKNMLYAWNGQTYSYDFSIIDWGLVNRISYETTNDQNMPVNTPQNIAKNGGIDTEWSPYAYWPPEQTMCDKGMSDLIKSDKYIALSHFGRKQALSSLIKKRLDEKFNHVIREVNVNEKFNFIPPKKAIQFRQILQGAVEIYYDDLINLVLTMPVSVQYEDMCRRVADYVTAEALDVWGWGVMAWIIYILFVRLMYPDVSHKMHRLWSAMFAISFSPSPEKRKWTAIQNSMNDIMNEHGVLMTSQL